MSGSITALSPIDMFFEQDGDWLGHDHWRVTKSAILSAHHLIEAALKEKEAAIDSRWKDAKPYDGETIAEEYYYLIDEPGSVLRAGLFCQVAGAVEHALFYLCLEASPLLRGNFNPRTEDKRDIVKNRIRVLGSLCSEELLGGESELTPLLLLRNVVTHASSETAAAPAERREQIEKWMAEHQDLASMSGAAIRLTPAFIPYVLEFYDALLVKIVSKLSGPAQAAVVQRKVDRKPAPVNTRAL